MTSTNTFEATTSVGDIAANNPLATAIFARHKMDYCCGGNRPLAEACGIAGADMATVIQELEELARPEQDIDLTTAPLWQVVDHIEEVHHSYLKEAMPAIWAMMKKVLNAHSEAHPEYVELHQVTGGLFNELTGHLKKEEEILFPLIRKLSGADVPTPPGSACAVGHGCTTPEGPIQVMEAEHETAGAALRRMRELANDYAIPEFACTTLTALLKGLEECETDIHNHIHKENNILHPRVREMISEN